MFEVQVYACGSWHTYGERYGALEHGNTKSPGAPDGLADSAVHAGAIDARVIRLRDRQIVYESGTGGSRYHAGRGAW